MKNLKLAALDVILVLVTLVWAMFEIYPFVSWVFWLTLPYLIWVFLATCLQLTITVLNRDNIDLNNL